MNNQRPLDSTLLSLLVQALKTMQAGKPLDRSEKARHWAVTVTELEKVVAYFKTYVVDEIS